MLGPFNHQRTADGINGIPNPKDPTTTFEADPFDFRVVWCQFAPRRTEPPGIGWIGYISNLGIKKNKRVCLVIWRNIRSMFFSMKIPAVFIWWPAASRRRGGKRPGQSGPYQQGASHGFPNIYNYCNHRSSMVFWKLFPEPTIRLQSHLQGIFHCHRASLVMDCPGAIVDSRLQDAIPRL